MGRSLHAGLALAGLVALGGSPGAKAQGPAAAPLRAVAPRAAPPAPVRATAEESAALAAQLRLLVVSFLPDPLYADGKKWDLKRQGPRGKMRNDGRWVKVRITAPNAAERLRLTVTDMVAAPGRKTFTLNLTLPAQVDLERQTWKMGVRLYSGSTRARLRLRLALHCELVTRVEKSASWLPDMVLRLRVLASTFAYDDVVVEHTAGVGGEAARVLGELMLGVVKEVRPGLERRLIDKANAAVVKAGDSKEVRISLADWLNRQQPAGAKKGAAGQ